MSEAAQRPLRQFPRQSWGIGAPLFPGQAFLPLRRVSWWVGNTRSHRHGQEFAKSPPTGWKLPSDARRTPRSRACRRRASRPARNPSLRSSRRAPLEGSSVLNCKYGAPSQVRRTRTSRKLLRSAVPSPAGVPSPADRPHGKGVGASSVRSPRRRAGKYPGSAPSR